MPKPLLVAIVVVAIAIAGVAYGLARGGDEPGPSGAVERLTVTFRPDVGAKPVFVKVACSGADVSPACAGLTDDLLAPVAADRVCTMVYGGPEVLTITGQRDGKRIDSSFSRQNGCEIARWNDVARVLKPLGIAGLVG